MTDLDATIRAVVLEVLREELPRLLPAARPDLLTVAEFARRCSISPSTVRAAIREGRLPATRIGRAVRVPTGAAISRPSNHARADAARNARRARLLGGR